MKVNVSGLSIAFYLFCAAVIFSEYNYVGSTTQSKGFFKKNGTTVEVHNRVKLQNSKKDRWPASVKETPSAYSGNLGLNHN